MQTTIAIMFDTSALRELGWTSSPFSSVLQLAKAGLVEVYLPELVVAERRTQWAEQPTQALAAATVALRDLASNPIIASHHAEQVRQVLTELEKLDVEEMSVAAIEQFLRENRISEVPMTFEQSKAAWKAYFSGTPPHRKAKTRDDIPDAHIFEAAKDLLAKHRAVHFICADKRLGSALKPLFGASVYLTLEELFESGVLADPTQLWARDKLWRELQHLAPLEEIKAELRSRLEQDLEDQLHDLDFTDHALPGFETVAHVAWAMGGELIEIQNPDDWGGGIMSFEVEFECDAGLRMRFSHDEARALPDWIDVDWGHSGVVHATANVRLKVESTVDVEVNLRNVERGEKPLLKRADFNDPQLFIIKT